MSTNPTSIPDAEPDSTGQRETPEPGRILPPENPQNSPARRGRPRLKIDSEMVRKLAEAGLATHEVAAVLSCSEDTLTRRYMRALKDGRAAGIGSVKRELYRQAIAGNLPAVLAFLRGYAGFNDRVLRLAPATEESEPCSPPNESGAEEIESLSYVDRNMLRAMTEKLSRISELNSRSCLEQVGSQSPDALISCDM